MNINNTEEIETLEISDFFNAVASETTPISVYEDGRVLDVHTAGLAEKINYADAKMVLNIRTDIRRKLIDAYPEYGVFVACAGDVVRFGSFPQREGKGADSIEWLVLAKEGRKLLLTTKDAIEAKAYNDKYEAVTWETSSIRKWLNGEFLETAFTKEEKMMIPFTSVIPDRNENVYGNHGNNTLDKVFLLSVTEAKKYFASNADRIASGVELAEKHGAVLSKDENRGSWWWLRTPGWNPMYYTETFVNDTGEIKTHGDAIDHCDNAARPVIWLGLD